MQPLAKLIPAAWGFSHALPCVLPWRGHLLCSEDTLVDELSLTPLACAQKRMQGQIVAQQVNEQGLFLHSDHWRPQGMSTARGLQPCGDVSCGACQ